MIKCPYCDYDGSDLDIGRTMPSTNAFGVSSMYCSKCKRRFNITKEMFGEIDENRMSSLC